MPQLDGVSGSEKAMGSDDETAVGVGYDIDRWFGHRVAFRHHLFSGQSE
ncbi:MAG: hypothetical protein ABW000_10630 [Actinoplanes sp.]